MAPQNRRIVTLNQIVKRREPAPSPLTKNNSDVSIKPSSNGDSASVSFPSQDRAYCRSVAGSSSSSTSIPLHHIPSLPGANVCEDTLNRIHREFAPIIRRRGYNVVSISEFCCCGDGLDYRPNQRGRKRRGQSNQVLGYNQTNIYGRTRSHSIHLRLRHPNQHNQTRYLPWEDVAGTMAHELSHCVHQNHSAAFYKLMEEIMEEHATNQVNAMGGLIYGNDAQTSAGTETRLVRNEHDMGQGQRLGGSMNGGSSRLLTDHNGTKEVASSSLGPGNRLGGRKHISQRETMANAAETRRQQMEQMRRLIERSQEPCVFELLEDDDGSEASWDHRDDNFDTKPRAMTSSDAALKSDTAFVCPVPDNRIYESDAPQKKSRHGSVIDLTGDDETFSPEEYPVVRDNERWTCSNCTLANRALSLVCDACLSIREHA